MNFVSENELQQIRSIQSPAEERAKVEKLPDWVKCAYCGEGPKWGDLLGELVRHSTALAHQSCAAKHGKVFGLNAGTLHELGRQENDLSVSS